MTATWLIYGANGYTARLIAESARAQGSRPVLAGRNTAKVQDLGAELDLPTRVFDLTDPDGLDAGLDGITAVLNCAGPFSETFRPLFEACLRTKTHYLDITGEIAVFEELFERGSEAKQAGITAISGVGFDVVPTDCLAAMLKRQLPDATSLRLGLSGSTVLSPGTAKTILSGLRHGGRVRRGGELRSVPLGAGSAWIPFRRSPSFGLLSPLADVTTAFHSTGIPDIDVYLEAPAILQPLTRAIGMGAGLLTLPPIKGILERLIELAVRGPDPQQRASGGMLIWGEAVNATGEQATMWLRVPEAYSLTVDAALASVNRVLAGGVAPGSQTPSTAFGADFVLSLPGVTLLRDAPA